MRILKNFIKKIIRFYYRIRIKFHKKQSIDIKYEDALAYLNNIYPFKEYDLSEKVLPIDKYNYDLSIIVPVYNASDFLKECIDSLINQNTKYSYEVICIDDGSTDNSLEILSSYNDKKIKVIHQENGGIASARNKGLNMSTGKYVGFVDNDDFVTGNYVEVIMNEAISKNVDYIKCSYIICDNSKKVIEKKEYKNKITNDLNDTNDYELLKGYVWGGCYKRKIWENFCFPKNSWYEDIVNTMYIYSVSKTIATIDKVLYYKRAHSTNASNILWKENNIKCLDQLYLVKSLVNLKDKYNINSNKVSFLCELNELGEYLYKRISRLSNDIKENAFVIACEIINRNEDYQIDNYKLEAIKESFNKKDYKLWELIGEYSYYENR